MTPIEALTTMRVETDAQIQQAQDTLAEHRAAVMGAERRVETLQARRQKFVDAIELLRRERDGEL